MPSSPHHSVVITGYGLVTHAGSGCGPGWAALMSQQGAGRRWSPAEDESAFIFAAAPDDYRPHRDIPRNLVHFLDSGALHALDASLQAIAMAGLQSGADDSRRFAVTDGLPYRAPGQPTMFVPYGNTVARVLGVRGAVLAVGGAEASGMLAIAEGARLVADGDADVVIAVAAQALQPQLCEHVRGQGWLSESCALPFDARHSGFVPGEGAAALVLESHEHARARGAPVVAKLAATGLAFDSLAEPLEPPGAETAGRAMQAALANAGYLQNQVDLLVSAADGRPAYDSADAVGALRTFGRHAFFAGVTSATAGFGHTLAASGPCSVVAALESIRRQHVFAVAGFQEPIERLELAIVREPRDERLDCVLVSALGTGGSACAILLERERGGGS